VKRLLYQLLIQLHLLFLKIQQLLVDVISSLSTSCSLLIFQQNGRIACQCDHLQLWKLYFLTTFASPPITQQTGIRKRSTKGYLKWVLCQTYPLLGLVQITCIYEEEELAVSIYICNINW
jgi:hypothetical protein